MQGHEKNAWMLGSSLEAWARILPNALVQTRPTGSAPTWPHRPGGARTNGLLEHSGADQFGADPIRARIRGVVTAASAVDSTKLAATGPPSVSNWRDIR